MRDSYKVVEGRFVQYCPYFASAVRKISVPGMPHPMRVPICRCALTEEAVSRLLTNLAGIELSKAFTSQSLEGEHFPILGPDLDTIAANKCTQTRRDESCCPAFEEMLAPFGLEIALPDDS